MYAFTIYIFFENSPFKANNTFHFILSLVIINMGVDSPKSSAPCIFKILQDDSSKIELSEIRKRFSEILWLSKNEHRNNVPRSKSKSKMSKK
jgi:hypothetical protein